MLHSPVVAEGGEGVPALLYDLPGYLTVHVGLVDGVGKHGHYPQNAHYVHNDVVLKTLLTRVTCK